jgi:hypothetical protein
MRIKEFVSQLFDYRIKNGQEGWDEFTKALSRNGTWSIAGSPAKFQAMILEMLKRIEILEEEHAKRSETKGTTNL